MEWLEGEQKLLAEQAADTVNLGIHDRGLLIAYLHVQRRSPFTDGKRRLLGSVAQGVSRSLALLSQQTESRLLVRRNQVDIEKFGLATTPSIQPSVTSSSWHSWRASLSCSKQTQQQTRY